MGIADAGRNDSTRRATAAVRIPWERLSAWVAEILERLGLDAAQAARAAATLLLADLRGVDSHGVARLPAYAQRLLVGAIDPGARISVLREGPATLALDANNGFGLTLAVDAMERTIAKATESGICLTTVRRANHFGIAGAYPLMAARAGLGGLAMTNSAPLVVPVFGGRGMLGTNPIAFAVPTGPSPAPPLVIDLATSTVAWGKVEIARRAGQPIADGWALDAAGVPTTDPNAAHWLTPLGGDREHGGHKGYALAVMVDALCGPLAGAAWSAHVASFREPNRPADLGHAFMAWRIDAFREPEAFFADVRAMLAELRATAPAADHPDRSVLVPGDPELVAEAENRELGVPVKLEVLAELDRLAAELGLPRLET